LKEEETVAPTGGRYGNWEARLGAIECRLR